MTQRHKDLIVPYKPQTYTNFADLPEWAAKSVYQYMEEGDVDDIDAWLKQFMFVCAKVPTEILCAETLKDINRESKHFETFEDYHEWYQATNDADHGSSKWACILSSYEDEVFQDGWHRFHYYVSRGLKHIPVVGLIFHKTA